MSCRLDTMIAATLALATFIVVSTALAAVAPIAPIAPFAVSLSGLIPAPNSRPDLRRQPHRAAARPDQHHGDLRRDQPLGIAPDFLREHDAGAGDGLAAR